MEDSVRNRMHAILEKLCMFANLDMICEKSLEANPDVARSLELKAALDAAVSRIDAGCRIEAEDLLKLQGELEHYLTDGNIPVQPDVAIKKDLLPADSPLDYLSGYLEDRTEPHSLSLRRRPSKQNDSELLSITSIGTRLKRKNSRGDTFREYKERLKLKFSQIATDFNISFCSCQFGPHEFLLGIKNKSKKQELVKINLQNETCTKVMRVGLIIDIITFGEFIVMAERNEEVRVFRDNLMLLSLSQPFQTQYFQNSYGNDSRIFHAYKDETLFYITDTNKIAQYDVRNCFAERVIDLHKSSFIECLCVLDSSLYAITIGGEVIQYGIFEAAARNRTFINKHDFKFCTIVTCRDVLLASGLDQKNETNIIVVLGSSLEVQQVIELPRMSYPIHKIITFEFFNFPTVAMLYKHTGSTVYLYGFASGQLKKLVEIPPFASMMYDLFYYDESIVLCGWEEKDVIQMMKLRISHIEGV